MSALYRWNVARQVTSVLGGVLDLIWQNSGVIMGPLAIFDHKHGGHPPWQPALLLIGIGVRQYLLLPTQAELALWHG